MNNYLTFFNLPAYLIINFIPYLMRFFQQPANINTKLAHTRQVKELFKDSDRPE
jgi:hypothetical protein